jgi:four helix bundle protein
MRTHILELKAKLVCSELVSKIRNLIRQTHEFELLSQVLRSSTSILANIEEAIAAQSRRDFIAKLCISRKEMKETLMWLELLNNERIIDSESYNTAISKLTEIFKMLNSSISTASKGIRNSTNRPLL